MTNATITEFQLTNEIKELGISRVYTGFNGNDDETMLFVECNDVEKPLSCKYDKRFKNVARELEVILCNSGFDNKSAKKLIVLLSKVWIDTERQKQQTQRNKVLAEIRDRRSKVKYQSEEEWKIAVEGRYQVLRQVIEDNIPEIWTGLEFELSILRILNIYGNTLPFIGLLLARPGSYKTQITSLLEGWYCTYYTDNFTPQALVSHSTALTEEELEKNDMLPKMKNRIFLTPELSPIFTVKEEDLTKTLGIITRIADGHGYKNDSGAHGQRGYNNIMFTWLGAAVDIPYRVYKTLGALGFKLYFFRLPFKEDSEDDLLFGMTKDFDSQINAIKSALYDYLYTFETGPHLIYDNELLKVKWDTSKDEVDAKKYIIKLGILVQHLRCVVKTWHIEDNEDSEYGYSVSQPEDPKRAIRALYNLAKGHALITGCNYITLADIPIVVKTVLSTAMIERVALLFFLIDNGGKASTIDITHALHVTGPTARRTMKELEVIGLVESYDDKGEHDKNWIKHIKLKDRFNWFLTREFDRLREGFIPVDNSEFMEDPRRPRIDSTKKGNYTPYTHDIEITEDQLNDSLPVFETIERQQLQQNDYSTMDVDKGTVGGEELRKRLVEGVKVNEDQAAVIVGIMIERGVIEKVSYDTYRKKK